MSQDNNLSNSNVITHPSSGANQNKSGKKPKKPQPQQKKTRDEIIEEILQSLKMYKDSKSNYFADIFINGQLRFVLIKSKSFSQFINNEVFKQYKQYLNKNSTAAAIARAEYYAEYHGTQIEACQRFKGDTTKAYIDICDQKETLVEIDSSGWRYVQQQNLSDIKFIRAQKMLPLSIPDQNGGAHKILKYVNLSKKQDEILFLVCLCIMPITSIIRPIIIFHGTGGSGKTFASNFFRSLLDNVNSIANNTQSKEGDFALVFSQNAIPVFDNMSGINKKQSDMFCKAITGGALDKRTLYTDADVHTTNFEGPALITSINMPSTEPDFLDRCIVVRNQNI